MAETRTSQWGLITIGLGLFALAAAVATLPWNFARFGPKPTAISTPTATKDTKGDDQGPDLVDNLPQDHFGPIEAIQPIAPVGFPDDPPPHEGALRNIEYVVEPPDLIAVEVLEALPGRPISGERLVRPDSSIGLDFYGDLHVAGLTTSQIKEKVILRLRDFIPDATLGLLEANPETGAKQVIPPAKSDRVFEEVRAYNSKNFYVLGEVNAPGRLPCTGDECVLQAIIAAGHLTQNASPDDITLVRPARGDSPERSFPIDWYAITRKADKKVNLQMLPGDRLIVGGKGSR
jgi:protein involved in polysaccharide export with SLBB domain